MWSKYRNTIGPLFLLTCPPVFVMLMWYTNTHLGGSLSLLYQLIYDFGFFQTVYTIWQPVFWGSAIAWKMILYFILFQMVLMRVLPGRRYEGPTSPKGNIPHYKANGVSAFLVTILVFCVGSFVLKLFPATIIYDHLGELLSALNLFSLTACLFLYLKGIYFPSSMDAGKSGNFIFDYYWGTELYPKILGWPIKMLIACRLGMMSWCLFLLSYAAKQHELYGLSNAMVVSVALQFIYVAKFYYWEPGYLSSLDMMHDRAGYYICWGCMVWLPCVYTSPSMYLVAHPIHLNTALALGIFLLGTASIMANYFADRQRQMVRATNGECKVWGKKPRLTYATYKTDTGIIKQNLLLSSGWWGIARHFHYIPELMGAFLWSVPALFTNFLPYFYVLFLAALLITRAFRDDQRCAKKYGIYWQEYCDLVPYKLVPYLV